MRFYSGSAFRFWCSLYCESLQRQGKASKGQFSDSVQEVLHLEQNTHCRIVIKVVSSEFTMFRNCDWPCVGTPIWLCWKGLGVNFVKVRIPRGRSFFKQSRRHLVFWLSGCWASVEESGQSATCSICIHIYMYIMQYTCRILPYTTIPYTTYTTFWKQPMSPGEFCHQRSFFCLQELFDCLGPRFCGQLLGDLGEVGSCDARQTNKMTSFDDMHKIQTGYTTHMYIQYIYIYSTHYIYTIFYIVEMIELYRELLTAQSVFFPHEILFGFLRCPRKNATENSAMFQKIFESVLISFHIFPIFPVCFPSFFRNQNPFL